MVELLSKFSKLFHFRVNGFFHSPGNRLLLWAILLMATFYYPIYQWFQFSMKDDLYSHLPLIPLIVGLMVRFQLRSISTKEVSRYIRWPGVLMMLCGVGLIAGCYAIFFPRGDVSEIDMLPWVILGLYTLFVGGVFLLIDQVCLRQLIFPLAFLIFAVPMPSVCVAFVENALQHGSADMAYFLFQICGMSVFREGTFFKLPGFSMEIGPQCSGIRSSLVLFISSLIAAHWFLESTRHKILFALFAIPLGIFRNGLRIWVIGMLCVRIGPHMIDSPIHHKGGPLFFIISLIPLFALLVWLRKCESKSQKPS